MASDANVNAIVQTLEAACQQIEMEMEIINEDLAHAAECVKRYGDVYLPPLRYLTQLRDNKRLRFKELVGQLEGLKTQIDCTATLLRTLNTAAPLTLVQKL